MGNLILGKRSRSFYKGFNPQQLEYIRQKFQSISEKGNLSKKKFIDAYKITEDIYDKFLTEVDFSGDALVDEYEFICIVHSLCSSTIEQLGAIIYSIITTNQDLTENNLLTFTSTCLSYNAYLGKTKLTPQEISKANRNKFQKYDYDKNKTLDRDEFAKICLKDEDYKKWLFNMGFLTKKQLDFQDQIYDLVDSDIGEEIQRHQTETDANVDKIKRGIEHRQGEDEFEVVDQSGQQSVLQDKPWLKAIKGISIKNQNANPPSQFLTIDHIFGYRSFDCRSNLKYDSKGRIVYHNAAVGIVLEPKQGDNYTQSYIQQHQDDISCLDINGDMVVSGQVGTKPMILVWETNMQKGSGLKSKLMITEELQCSVGNVTISKSKNLIAANCNDLQHKVVIYDLKKVVQSRVNLTSSATGVVAKGPTSKNVIFDIQFTLDEKMLVAATIKDILFITFEKGQLTTNRGIYNIFAVTPTFCLASLETRQKEGNKIYMLSGMGNGSVYFWEKQQCVRALSGHSGSVSSICERNDVRGFVSGDTSGKIIIWNDKFEKEKTLNSPKTNSVSMMIVSLCCNFEKQILIGTKSSDIFILRIGDEFSKARKVMSGHSEGKLNCLAIHKTESYFYTGGDDQRLIKWEYRTKKKLEMQIKCQYKIKSMDINANRNFLVVGYSNGVVDCFGSQKLDKNPQSYREIKNPDQQILNLVRLDEFGTVCAVSYQMPTIKILLLEIKQKQFRVLSEIPLSSKAINIDFQKNSKFIRFNTADFDYMVYDISNATSPKKVKILSEVKQLKWLTHTVIFSAQTQGILTQGVAEEDITCCDRGNKYNDVFIIGDKYSKLKLFSYPCKQNKIFNKYFGHSNEITAVKFNSNQDRVVSIGGEEKCIIVWEYHDERIKNDFEQSNLDAYEEQEIDAAKMKKNKNEDEFGVEQVVGEQSSATKAFLGQIKIPSGFQGNPKKDNKPPKQNLSIKHVFGIRNKYIKDEVRNQCKFSKKYDCALFPTACLAVKMKISNRQQEFYLQHKEDIVSFAVDAKREVMATGQMAQKNPYSPKKKILTICVWDIEGKKILNKLDGFHTIAIVLLQFSPSSQLLFSCGHDQKNTFAVYNWKSGSILFSGPISRGKVNGIAWKSDEQFMTCGNDHIKFWTGSKSRQGSIDGKTQGMVCCVSSKNIYITGSGAGGIYNWIGNKATKIAAHGGKVQSLVVSDKYLYSGGDDGKILEWQLQANGQVKTSRTFYDVRNAFVEMIKKDVNIKEEQFGVLSIDFSPKGDLLIATKGASIVHVSENNSKSNVFHTGHYSGQLWALAPSKKEEIVYTGGDDGTVRAWDLQNMRELNRVYFQHGVRGIDTTNEVNCKLVVADSRAKLYLYNKNLSIKHSEYEGKIYSENIKQKDPFVQQIKFSPDNKYIMFGSHGKSLYLECLQLTEQLKLNLKKTFMGGSSATLHIDWSNDSKYISMNSQAYELLFFDTNGNKATATSMCDTKWATWTQKFGFPVQGIFQGVDYTDVNTVCRDPTGNFIAVGYDDQTVRIFKYPCYIVKQVHKQYEGHSSHVTRVRFTNNYLVSLGGNDRTIIVWNIQNREKLKQLRVDEDQSDGLDDLDDDVDLPMKSIQRKKKKQVIEQFYQTQDEGDEFMAIKPWLGAIKQPSYKFPTPTQAMPNSQIILDYVHGYRCKDARQNLYFNNSDDVLIYHAAAVLIYHNINKNTQDLLVQHNDDILSIDYHRKSNQVITGELGPKPLVCLFRNGKLSAKFKAPVKKGVMAVAISPNGNRAVCVGMDEDHEVSVLDLEKGTVVATSKGGKKLILKLGWITNNQFVSAGIKNYAHWTLDGKLTSKKGQIRDDTLVSLAIEDRLILTGAGKGVILSWTGTTHKEHYLTRKNGQQIIQASVVQSISIQNDFIAAGTKDAYIYVLDKSMKIANIINMTQILTDSLSPSIRSIDFFNDKACVGTFGSQIFIVQFKNIMKEKQGKSRNVMKGHYSPNNTWTNQVWGLQIDGDLVFTTSDDATVRCWSIQDRKLLGYASLNYSPDGIKMEMDKKTKDYQQSAKGRAVSLSPDKKKIIVGTKNGTVRVYKFNRQTSQIKFTKEVFRHAKEWISDIKTAFNTVIIGSHDNAIYVYNYQEDNNLTLRYKPLLKHSSYITHIDVSQDSCFMQSTCGAYELLFWDINVGKQLTSGASALKDERWATWTSNLGWPVQGIYPKCTDGTFINAVDRSHTSVNNTLFKDDQKSHYLLAAGNDNGKVCLYNYPSLIKSSKFVEGNGHSSHVTNVRWSDDDKYIISTGGEDQCVMYWRVLKKTKN